MFSFTDWYYVLCKFKHQVYVKTLLCTVCNLLVYMHAYIHTHLFADFLLYDYFINLTINYHIAESFRGRTFGKFIFWAFGKNVWWMNTSAKRQLIISTSLNDFSLANHGWFTKFAKLYPPSNFPAIQYRQTWITIITIVEVHTLYSTYIHYTIIISDAHFVAPQLILFAYIHYLLMVCNYIYIHKSSLHG